MQDLNFYVLPSRLRDAKKRGSRIFYTGKPCKRMHFSFRIAPSGLCSECKRIHAQSLRATKAKREETNKKKREYWNKIKTEKPDIYQRSLDQCREYHKKISTDRCEVWSKRQKTRSMRRSLPETRKRETAAARAIHNRRIQSGDELYIATLRWRQLIYRSLRILGRSKERSTIEELGYSAIELRDHIERQFQPGMSWSNHGEWHIDHIRPLSSFPKDTPASIVNSLDNLQPLWAFDNLSKHDSPI